MFWRKKKEFFRTSRNVGEDESQVSVLVTGNPKFSNGVNDSEIHYLYCIVFPVRSDKRSEAEYSELRQNILDRIVDAGLVVECFYSVQFDEVYCKVGASDNRLVAEADASNETYLLDINPASMKVVAEGDKDEERGPIHLEPPFTRVEKIQKLNYGTNEWESLDDSEAERLLKKRTKLSPFEQIHAPYNSEWRKYARRVYGVEIYKQYADGSILRHADRIKLIQAVLERSVSMNRKTNTRGAGLALDHLQFDNTILGSFPLNTAKGYSDARELSVDELLEKWNGSRMPWYMRMPWLQPLNDVRDYFGEKIALYFAFLSHYTLWLLIPAVLGSLVFTQQMLNVYIEGNHFNFFNPTSVVEEVSADNEVTLVAKVYTEVFTVPYFALFVSCWATLCIEYWKRKQARHALRWGMVGYERHERSRVEFKPSHRLPSPVTGRVEPYYSEWNFMFKLVGSSVVLAVGIVVVLGAIAAILYLKVVLQSLEFVGSEASPIVALVINAATIQGMGFVYRKIARRLNDWENHRSDSNYEDNLIVKTFIFNFVNSYTTLFYFAFVKSGSTIYDKTQFCTPIFEDLVEEDDKLKVLDNCFGGLGYSLLIIFALQLVANNAIELILPYAIAMYHRCTNTKGTEQAASARQQGEHLVHAVGSTTTAFTKPLLKVPGKMTQMLMSSLSIASSDVSGESETPYPVSETVLTTELGKVRTRSPAEDQFYLQTYESTFYDFMELAIQYGYVTLFVAAFPLAPALALLNNVVEVRVDSYKLCKLSRRPKLQGAQDIGTWQKIFTVLSYLAVVSNAGVICFTSTTFVTDDLLVEMGFAPENVSGGRVWMFNIFIVAVLAVKVTIGLLVKDIPKSVEIQTKRNEYLVRKCFRRERDDADFRQTSTVRLEKMTSGSNLHVAPTRQHQVYSADPEITKLLIDMAKEIVGGASSSVDFEHLFRNADVNNNGNLSVDEFTNVLKSSGGAVGEKLSADEVGSLVRALDLAGNGRIDYSEFARFLSAASGGSVTESNDEDATDSVASVVLEVEDETGVEGSEREQ